MSTSASFNNMLKRYMPFNLLVEEVKKRNYFWNKVAKDENWYGGTLDVPFEGGEASSLSFGSLTDASDIAETVAVLGTISDYKELWGTMVFNEKDLDLHKDMKASFLQILPQKVNQFVNFISTNLSNNLLNGPYKDKLAANGADGSITVRYPERFTVGEKVFIDDDDSAAVAAYVTAINMETAVLTIKDARSAGANVDATAYTTAQSAAVYVPGAQITANPFTALKDVLLSNANGGGASIYGQTKTDYPYLQAVNIDGTAVAAANILDKIFDAFFEVTRLGKGNPTEILCSFKHFSNIAKALEESRRYSVADKAAGYGFRKVTVLGPQGEMMITGLRDMDDDVIYIMDWSAMKFRGSNFFNRKRHQDGDEFFLVRSTSGYKYIVDIRMYGDLVVHAPSYCGIVHTISY